MPKWPESPLYVSAPCTAEHTCADVQVDMSDEEDQFQAVTTSCLNVLILAVETRLDVALQQMTRMPWATLETVCPGHTTEHTCKTVLTTVWGPCRILMCGK